MLGAVETLVRRRLLREESVTASTTSATTRCARWSTSRSAARAAWLLHRAVAETLEQQGEGEPHERDARLAEHYERGQVWSKAVHYMVLAAQRSQKLFAMREALHWLDRAIELADAHRDALDGARAHRLARAARTGTGAGRANRRRRRRHPHRDRRRARDAPIAEGPRRAHPARHDLSARRRLRAGRRSASVKRSTSAAR